MLRMFWFVALTACFLLPSISISAPTPIDLSRVSGEITGTINYCGQSGSEGIEVSIPGKSFMARTDFQGKFTLSYVPEGAWSLVFHNNNQRIGSKSGIQVLKRELTDLNLTLGTIVLCTDLDGDGYTPDQDCNDANPIINPSAPELCGNGLDDNCNGYADESCPACSDNDGDGSFAQIGCGIVDCNDANSAISPTAVESCGDGIDNDCDNQVDEADAFDAVIYYVDFDGDGYGNPFETVTACNPPEGYSATGTDCNDGNADVNPSSYEVCDNGIDDNCDEITDPEGCSDIICTVEEVTAYEYCAISCTSGIAECLIACVDSVSENCGDAILALGQCTFTADCYEFSSESDRSICIQENCSAEWDLIYSDIITTECAIGESRPCTTTNTFGTCEGIETCGYFSGWSECSAQTPQEEICGDFNDNNCNDQIDEGCPSACEPPLVDCGEGSCFDLSSDPNNCGGCNVGCVTGDTCVAGVCEPPTTCIPDCTNRECGDDGCGGTCGGCNASDVCNIDGLCEAQGEDPCSPNPCTSGDACTPAADGTFECVSN